MQCARPQIVNALNPTGSCGVPEPRNAAGLLALFGLVLVFCLRLDAQTAETFAPTRQSSTFTNPVATSGADPWVVQHEGYYYYCYSRRGSVWVSRTTSLVEIGNAEAARVWMPPPGTEYSRDLWAPELHYLRGKWYIYVAADDGDNANHRMYVLEGTSQDPLAPFTFRGRIAAPSDRWAIDGTVLQMPDDRLYFIWSGWEGTENVAQHLYIAPMSDPLTISGERVRISTPEYDWEKHGRPLVNEGPEVLWNSNRLFIIYSASGSWGDHYCLGQLTWTGGDVLDPKSWVKKPTPVFSGTDDVISPGHASFVKSPNGTEDWIVYHVAKHRGAGWNRQVHMQRFTWNEDGSPNFGKPVAPGVPIPLPADEFQNPINGGADPWMTFYEGCYYLTTTQRDAIRMWKGATISALKKAKPVTVWKDTDPTRSHAIWAPEFHFVSNRWYLYYTATSSDESDDNHRMHVLESAGTDPLGPYSYKGRLFDPANDNYAIDGTVFQTPDGRWYFIWAARPGHVLTIARLANPWTIEGHGVVIPASGFGCQEVREGPVVLHRNGKLFLVYSACDTGKPDYKLGMLIADENADVLDPASWKQYPRPVFERDDADGVFGPGHNGFFRSPDGTEDWIVYHAKTTSEYTYRGRTTRVQKFGWNPDGTPNFGDPLPLSAWLEEPSRANVRFE
ncbi:MAG TPA: glycoside hydrolase family 43 protein [Verrucomicrobiota bacterium]|nr:glycoside hydrolase family 43 protein [Verrucomicrobiota bacterium]